MTDIGSSLTVSRLGPGVRGAGGSFGASLAATAHGVAGSFLAERDRWGLWVPVLLAAGILAYFSLPAEPPPWMGAAGIAVVLAVLLAACSAVPPGLRPSLRLAATVPALVLLGFAAAQLRTALVDVTPLAKRVGPIALTGVVRDIQPLPTGARVVLSAVRTRSGDTVLPAKVRIRLRGDMPPMAPGDRIRVSAVLLPPPAPVIPGGYDFQREAFFAELGAVGYAVGPASVTAAADGESSLATGIARLRHAIAEAVGRVEPPPTGAIITALLVGERGAIPAPVMAAIRDSGLAHLLAISGLHIGLVALVLMLVLRSGLALIPAVALRYPIKKWAACGSLLGAGFYTLLAGAPVPSQRAFVMVTLVLLAVLVNRRTTPMRLIAVAAIVLCLTQPEAILGPSFQMSFFAVTALIAFYEQTWSRPAWFSPRFERWRPLIYLFAVVMSSLIATLATAPFVVFHFNRLAVYGLFANLVAVPLTSVWIMPWAVAALVLMPLGLAGLALVPMGWGVDIIIWVAKQVASWPGAAEQLPSMPPAALAAAAFGLLWLCLWQRRWRLFGLIPIAIGAAATFASPPADLLIDGGAKLIAVRAADGGLLLSSARASPMARDSWLRTGERRGTVATFPGDGRSSEDGRLTCDGIGCIWNHDGHVIAIARSGEALAEDCRHADVIVSVVPVRQHCPSARVIVDRFDLWRQGAHALWIRPEAIHVASVDGTRGARPWVPAKRRRHAPSADDDDDASAD
jgi:competence protein ComEC